MAPITKKTYLKKNNESCISQEKENVDPFDELFLSPLKQEVQFKPLSFWSKKLKEGESKKNKNKIKYGLYELSDSEDIYSPAKKKKKIKYESLERRTKKLQVRNINNNSVQAFNSTNNNSEVRDSSTELEKCVNASVPRNFKKFKISQSYCDSHLRFVTMKRRFSKKKCSSNSPKNDSTEEEEDNEDSTLFNVNSKRECYLPIRQFNESPAVKKFEKIEKGFELARDGNDSTLCFDSSCGFLSMHDSVLLNNDGSSIAEKLEKIDKGFELSRNSSESTFRFDSSYGSSSSSMLDSVMTPNDGSSRNNFSDACNTNEQTFGFENFTLGEKTLSMLINEITLSDLEFEENELKTAFAKMLEMIGVSEPVKTVLRTCINRSDSGGSSSSCEDSTVCQSDDTVLKGGGNRRPKKDVNALTNLMSDMTLKSMTSVVATTDSIHYESDDCESVLKPNEDAQEDRAFSSNVFRNVTTRRRFDSTDQSNSRAVLNSNTEGCHGKRLEDTQGIYDSEFRKNLEKLHSSMDNRDERFSLASDRFSCLPAPIFESTRVIENDLDDLKKIDKQQSEILNLDRTAGCFDCSVALKTGKKWLRSMSILKQIQNGSIVPSNFESTLVKGRKFQNFIKEILEMQNDFSNISANLSDATIYSQNSTKKAKGSFIDSCFYKSAVEFHSAINEENNSNATRLPTTFDRTVMNHTVKVIQPGSSFDVASAFRSALGLDGGDSMIEDSVIKQGAEEEESSVISPKDFILAQCGQNDVLPFEEYFNERTLKNCKKIGEGVYGEVFMYNNDTVIKIIPIEGTDKVNGEPQKKFEEILSEVVIALKLSNLRKGDNYRTSGFSEMKRCWCVVGKYPQYLLDLWDLYDQAGTGSENDSPIMFKSDQLYIILELANGGKDLESYVFNSAEQSLSIFIQTAFSLAAAEKAFQFEHRDLHWGNLLIAPTNEKFTTVVLDQREYQIPTKGVKVSIIDFTLSRIYHEGCCIFNDLSVDPSLFTSQGDYQFEIYRMMQQAVMNDWSAFVPTTNIYWLHYTLDKMLKMVRYKNKKAQVHKKYLKKLKILESVVLEYEDSADFVLNQELI